MIATDDPRRQALVGLQLERLRALIAALVPANAFYGPRLVAAGVDEGLASLEAFRALPLTTKSELAADQQAHPPYGSNLTYPMAAYTRLHQTSGTTSAPMRWLDTNASWQALLEDWQHVYTSAGVGPEDRVLFAFSFGPFLGFWTAFEAATQRGCLCLPGGGLSSSARLRLILDHGVTVLCCTPTYAIRLAEVALEDGLDLLRDSKVRRILVAGEPGGSIPAVRARIEALWPGARVHDHHGMTEMGPVSYEDAEHPGCLRIIETDYIAEVLDPATGEPTPLGETGELILTNLHRPGSPLLRYRTGDLVRPELAPDGGLWLRDGILGRADDMVLVRGVNIYPSAVEQTLRAIPEIAEYRVHVRKVRSMVELSIDLEPIPGAPDPAALVQRAADALRAPFSLRIPVILVPPGSLPRFDLKAKRWVKDPDDDGDASPGAADAKGN